MLRILFIKLITVFAVISAVPYTVAHAQVQAPASADQILINVSEDVLQAVRQNKDSYEASPGILQSELLAILDPAIDFEAFSRGVMGRYQAEASPEQRVAFVNAFKTTLAELYTSALVAAKIEDISIQKTTSKKPGRANVVMKASSADNNDYLLQYNMRQNDTGQWRIRNIILDGVNIGLTYRNQFKSAVESEDGDIGRVIVLWPKIIEGE